MRILLVAPMLPSAGAPGAIPILLHAQLEALGERNDVTLVTAIGDEPWEADAAEALLASGVDVRLADRRLPRTGRLRWRRRARLASEWLFGNLPWRTLWFAAPSVQAVISQLGLESRFDVIAVEDGAMSILELPRGIPAVLTEHEVQRPRSIDWWLGPPREWPRWALRELDRLRWPDFQRAAWRRFDRVQVFTEHDARLMATLAPEVTPRVRVNPFGLTLPEATDGAPERPATILFIGNFTHRPNRDAARWLALEIMPLIWAQEPRAELTIAGASPPRDVLELARPGVAVIADIANVAPLLEATAVFVVPVRTGGGMRLKVLQALASGKPVITTPRGAHGYGSRGADAPLVVAEDAKGIAAATTRLLADERCRRALGRRARAFAIEHHSPVAWGERLEAIYSEAIEVRHATKAA